MKQRSSTVNTTASTLSSGFHSMVTLDPSVQVFRYVSSLSCFLFFFLNSRCLQDTIHITNCVGFGFFFQLWLLTASTEQNVLCFYSSVYICTFQPNTSGYSMLVLSYTLLSQTNELLISSSLPLLQIKPSTAVVSEDCKPCSLSLSQRCCSPLSFLSSCVGMPFIES